MLSVVVSASVVIFLGILSMPGTVPADTACRERWGFNQGMVEHCESLAKTAEGGGTVLQFDFGVRAVERCTVAGDIVEYQHAGQIYRTARSAVTIQGPCPDGPLSANPPVSEGSPDVASSPSLGPSSVPSASSGSSPGGGTVNVRGYTRKDGTYVAPYTRSAPRR